MAERTADLTFDCQITQYGEGISPAVYEQLERVSAPAQMITLTPDVINSHHRNIVLTDGPRLVGYAALLTSAYAYTSAEGRSYPAVELGGAVVMPDFRRRGVGNSLFAMRVELMRDDMSYDDQTRAVVFTNPASRRYVDRTEGFRPLEKGETLGVAAYELCRGCTNRPLIGPQPWQDPTTCCDIEGVRVAALSDLRSDFDTF